MKDEDRRMNGYKWRDEIHPSSLILHPFPRLPVFAILHHDAARCEFVTEAVGGGVVFGGAGGGAAVEQRLQFGFERRGGGGLRRGEIQPHEAIPIQDESQFFGGI